MSGTRDGDNGAQDSFEEIESTIDALKKAIATAVTKLQALSNTVASKLAKRAIMDPEDVNALEAEQADIDAELELQSDILDNLEGSVIRPLSADDQKRLAALASELEEQIISDAQTSALIDVADKVLGKVAEIQSRTNEAQGV